MDLERVQHLLRDPRGMTTEDWLEVFRTIQRHRAAGRRGGRLLPADEPGIPYMIETSSGPGVIIQRPSAG